MNQKGIDEKEVLKQWAMKEREEEDASLSHKQSLWIGPRRAKRKSYECDNSGKPLTLTNWETCAEGTTALQQLVSFYGVSPG